MLGEEYEEILVFDEKFPFKLIVSHSPSPMKAHWHDAIELMYFYDTVGCDYMIKQNHYKINRNELTVVNPLEVHGCRDFGNATVCCMIFPPDILGSYNGILFNHHIKSDQKINEIFERIRSIASHEHAPFFIMSCLYELAGHLMSRYVFDNDSEIKRSRYKPIFKAVDLSVDYIKKHLHESICISDIATVVNLSESRVSHIFKEITGMTASEYVENARMNRAMRLLEESDTSITTVALSCGYCDNSYFSLRFRRKNGIPPSAYRKQHRSKST